jgi:hypothetical protein
LRLDLTIFSAAFVVAFAIGYVAQGSAAEGQSQDEPTFSVEFHDGKVEPLRLEVPANRRFKLELRNTGSTPAEFESRELRKEKVLAPNSSSFLVFRTLDAGEYPFFDDFHPEAPRALLVAK